MLKTLAAENHNIIALYTYIYICTYKSLQNITHKHMVDPTFTYTKHFHFKPCSYTNHLHYHYQNIYKTELGLKHIQDRATI